MVKGVEFFVELSGSWPEDAPHDNGNYLNTCHKCSELFIGHKRRVTCKLCETGDQPQTRTPTASKEQT